MKNLKVYDKNDYEMIQIRHEEASWGRIITNDEVKDGDSTLGGEIATDDTYEDDYMETCVDLCEAGFVLVNRRCVKR